MGSKKHTAKKSMKRVSTSEWDTLGTNDMGVKSVSSRNTLSPREQAYMHAADALLESWEEISSLAHLGLSEGITRKQARELFRSIDEVAGSALSLSREMVRDIPEPEEEADTSTSEIVCEQSLDQYVSLSGGLKDVSLSTEAKEAALEREGSASAQPDGEVFNQAINATDEVSEQAGTTWNEDELPEWSRVAHADVDMERFFSDDEDAERKSRRGFHIPRGFARKVFSKKPDEVDDSAFEGHAGPELAEAVTPEPATLEQDTLEPVASEETTPQSAAPKLDVTETTGLGSTAKESALPKQTPTESRRPVGHFRLLYESRKRKHTSTTDKPAGGIAVFEDKDGHITAVDTSKLA